MEYAPSKKRNVFGGTFQIEFIFFDVRNKVCKETILVEETLHINSAHTKMLPVVGNKYPLNGPFTNPLCSWVYYVRRVFIEQ